MARLVRTRHELRTALGGERPGLVPTMGALHEGHAALIRRAASENERVVVSVFVNPTQFDDAADLARYPRRLEDDLAVAARAGAELVWAPPADEVYPDGFATTVEVAGLGEWWEGAARPGHFRGVATVVTRLLGLVRPARAYFGEKDWQQVQIVRRLHADLALPGEIVGCPTVREADGLALSSRNGRLSPVARRAAAAVPRALRRMVALTAAGERAVPALVAAGQSELDREAGLTLDYLVVVDGERLEAVSVAGAGTRALIAVTIDGVRLIDTMAVPADDGAVRPRDEENIDGGR